MRYTRFSLQPDFEVIAPRLDACHKLDPEGGTRGDYLLRWAAARDLELNAWLRISYSDPNLRSDTVVLHVVFDDGNMETHMDKEFKKEMAVV